MNRRTIYLLIGAGLVVLIYLADQGYRNYVEAPSTARKKQLKKVDDAIGQANNLIAEKLSVQKQLDAYEEMSLPFDKEVTRTRYRGWLLETVQSVGLSGSSVDAGQPVTLRIKRQKPKKNQSSQKDILVRYNFSLRCRGSLNQIVSFLFQFYRSGHLHKIKTMTLNPSSGGTVIDAVFGIEALSMLRTERETQLTTASVKRMEKDDELYYAAIARRNIFSRTGSHVLHNTRVSGITFGISGKPQVWLKIGGGNPSQVLHNDETLMLESHRVEILDIQSEVVLLLVDGQPIKVGIGKSLMENPRLAKAPQRTDLVESGVNKTDVPEKSSDSQTPKGSDNTDLKK